MIQHGTFLKVVDNSGAKKVLCIKVFPGFKKRYGFLSERIKVSIKSLRLKRRSSVKVKKGSVHTALIVQTKKSFTHSYGDRFQFFENSAVLLNKQNKLIGSRIFGLVPKSLRFTKFVRLLSVAGGSVV